MANSIDWFTLSNLTMIGISIYSYVFCLGKIDSKVLKTGQEYKCKKKILTRINKVVKLPTTKLMIRSWKRQEFVSHISWIWLLPQWKPESYRIKRPRTGPLMSTKESYASRNVQKVLGNEANWGAHVLLETISGGMVFRLPALALAPDWSRRM